MRILSFFEIQVQYFNVDIKNLLLMTKSTFKNISFLGVLNWVTIHSQTEKHVEIISTLRDGKAKHARVFQIALKG